MRVYLAAPWIHREDAKNIANRLVQYGHVITHPWWDYEGEGEHLESEEFLLACAQSDVRGVRTADVVIVLNSAKSEGKSAEQGLAIAYGLPIICITPGDKPTSNIFHHLPNYTHVKTVEEALIAI